MRPRKSVNVASIVGSPEEEESRPNLRLRIVGIVVLLLFGVLVLRLWTLQVVEGKTYAAAVTRNQVRVVERPGAARRDRRPQRHRARVQHPAGGDPALAGRGGAEPGHRRHGGRAGRADAEAGAGVRQQQPVQPVRAGARRGRRVRRPPCSSSQTHQSEYPGVTRADRGAADLPPGRDHRHARPRLRRRHHPQLPGRAPQRRLHPGQPDRRVGDRGAVRAVPARRRRAPGPLGRRQRQRRRHARARPPRRSATPSCSTSTPGSSRRCRTTCSSRSWPTATRSTPSTAGIPPAPNGAVIVMNPQNGQVLALASYPTYDLNEWVGGISSANFTALQASGRREQLRHRGPVHARARPSSSSRRRPPCRTGLMARRPRTTTTPAASRSRAARPPGVTNDTGLHAARRPGRQRRRLQHLGRAHGVERLVLLQPGRHVLERPRSVRRHADPERGHRLRRGDDHRHRPARARPRAASTASRPGPSCTPRRPRASPTPPTWYTGDNIEMAFGQGETVLTPIEQAVAYSTFANGGTRYAPQVASEVVDPAHGQGHQEARAAGDRARGHLPDQLLAPCSRVSRASSPTRTAPPTATSRASRLRGTWPARRAPPRTRQGLEPNSWFVAFGPNPNPTVPRPGGDRPGWLRRPGRGAAGAQHLQLHRGQPRSARGEDADAGRPAQRRPRRRPTRRSGRRPRRPRPRRPARRARPARRTTTTTKPGGG